MQAIRLPETLGITSGIFMRKLSRQRNSWAITLQIIMYGSLVAANGLAEALLGVVEILFGMVGPDLAHWPMKLDMLLALDIPTG